MKEITQYTDT